MTKSFAAALFLVLPFLAASSIASETQAPRPPDNTWDYSVQLSASIETAPAKITLAWVQDSRGIPSAYTVSRRPAGTSQWSEATTLPGEATSFTDTDVADGRVYEYRLVKFMPAYTGYGYINVGLDAPLVDRRGTVLLVVDNTVAAPLAPELARLHEDLVGDGWNVVRRDVGRRDSVPSVKAVIKAVYDADPAHVRSLFLFGHVPVPYSGQLNPDGHPDHVGAWPADAYYGDMDGVWTDRTVNYRQTLNADRADAARMSNKPGDGKFDQTTLPSPVELEVGRVDLANMPGRLTWNGPATFPGEVELLRRYLDRDHAFRQRATNPPRRAVLGDYFGLRGGEAFAASGFRSFAPLVGADNIRNLNQEFGNELGVWIPHLAANDYLLAYGCGAGSYTTIAGLGRTGFYNDGATTELVQANVHGVFNLLFGSWLGDWDHEDDMLRAPLATDHGLVSVWSGRPHWFIHPLGTGETMGYVARLAMNNAGDYQTQINSAQNRIHIALMGDPTLRLHPVAPATNLEGHADAGTIALAWTASPDTALIGYHVYRAPSALGPFTRLTSAPIAATNFHDDTGSLAATYMVRAVKLERSPSGSYENAAQGVFWPAAGDAADRVASILPTGAAPAAGSASAAVLTIARNSNASTSGDAAAAPGGVSPAGRATAPATEP